MESSWLKYSYGCANLNFLIGLMTFLNRPCWVMTYFTICFTWKPNSFLCSQGFIPLHISEENTHILGWVFMFGFQQNYGEEDRMWYNWESTMCIKNMASGWFLSCSWFGFKIDTVFCACVWSKIWTSFMARNRAT